MPQVTLNVNTAQGLLLLDAFIERHLDYGTPEYGGPLPPGMTQLQQGKRVIVEVMRDYLHNFKRRQALATVDNSETELS